jgi:hypothetical protein
MKPEDEFEDLFSDRVDRMQARIDRIFYGFVAILCAVLAYFLG